MERQAKHQNISFALKNPLNDYQKQTTDRSYKDFYMHVRFCMLGNSCCIGPIGLCMLYCAHWVLYACILLMCVLGCACCILYIWLCMLSFKCKAVHAVLCILCCACCMEPIGMCMLLCAHLAVHVTFYTLGCVC